MFECFQKLWKGLEGVTFLEKVCHSGWALSCQKSMSFPVSSLSASYL